jgi:hypothetical protein
MATWTCPGCAKPYPEDDPKAIIRHVSECDYVDGAGQPIDVHLKFSVVHWYITAVRSDTLAEVTGGLPFPALLGRVEDGFEDEDTEDAVAEFLNTLTEDAGPAEADGFEISDVYDARRDQMPSRAAGAGTAREGTAAVPPGSGRGQCEFCHTADVPLEAVLSADPDQAVCGTCHADPRLATLSLAAVNDSRPVYVLSRGDLARIAGQEVTDRDAARIAKAIDNSTVSEALADAVWQVCGYLAEPDEPR